MALLSLKGITKEYLLGRTRVPALNGVDLDVEKGEFTVVMGPSGWPLGCSGVFGSRLSKMCLMPCTELASWNGGHVQHRLAVASIAPDACGSKT